MIPSSVHRLASGLSTEDAKTQERGEELQTSTSSPKPLTNEPFIKNLFLGKFDTVGV